MYSSANHSIAQQHIDELYDDADRRRLASQRPSRRSRVQAQRDALREVIGYRLVVLGWRLLDTSPRLAR